MTPFAAVTLHGESHPIGLGLTIGLAETDGGGDGPGLQPAPTNAQPVTIRAADARITELGIAEY